MHAIENSPSQHGTPVQVRLRDELLDELDEFRRNEADIPTRQKAIRQLLKEALAARQRRAGKKGADKCRITHTAELEEITAA
jgi:metal-responsive CopG/Arc/MetJ family transcriptional regulator